MVVKTAAAAAASAESAWPSRAPPGELQECAEGGACGHQHLPSWARSGLGLGGAAAAAASAATQEARTEGRSEGGSGGGRSSSLSLCRPYLNEGIFTRLAVEDVNWRSLRLPLRQQQQQSSATTDQLWIIAVAKWSATGKWRVVSLVPFKLCSH